MNFLKFDKNVLSNIKLTFTHRPGIDEVLGMTAYTDESPVDYFFHHDGMGSIVNIIL